MNLFKPIWANGRRKVSTWSPLATAFNTRPTTKPIFESFRQQTGLFNKPELTSYEGFYTLRDEAVADTDRLLEEAISNPTRPMVEILDELSDTLCKVADLAEFVRNAHPQPHFATAAEEACISISGVVEKLNTHKGLYEALRESIQRGTSGDKHVAELFLFDFEQNGIQLEEKKRQQVVSLNDTILQTGQRFMARSNMPRRVPRTAVPQNVRQFFSIEGDYILVNGAFSECGEAAAREAAYRLFMAPDARQEELLSTTLGARHKLAELCGFNNYAERAVKSSTMQTAANVQEFLDKLSDKLHDRANKDFEAMLQMKRRDTPYQEALMCWDNTYYRQRAKAQLLNVASCDYSPYLSLGACMEGLDMLCQELYGITLKSEEMLPGESWAPDVYKLAVVHESEGLLGHIYCDLYERPGKPNQDCHFTIQGGKLLPDGTYQNPIVAVLLSLSGGHRSGPALLGPGAVDNLFHEVGHALHSMLGRARYQHVAGTRCATDLAELPSVLGEYFACSPEVVGRFARHFQTGVPMPEDMLRRLCASKYLFNASEMQLQVFYSALDQEYHRGAAGGDTTAVLRRVQGQYYGLPYVEHTAWQHRFCHLIGYGAKYYSYLISRALASSVWRRNFAAQPLSRAAGDALRRGVLRHGGARPPQELLQDYLGIDITPEALANALIEDLDHNEEQLKDVLKYCN